MTIAWATTSFSRTRRSDVVAPSRRNGNAFAATLAVVLSLTAARIAIGRALPMNHDLPDLIDIVHALEGVLFLLASYAAAGWGWTRASYVIQSIGLGYLLGVGMGPTVSQIYWLGRSFPIADDALAGVDRFLGFEWPAYVSIFKEHPTIIRVLWVAYMTIQKQPFAIGVLLAYKRMPERLYAFVITQDICLAFVALVTVFLPAYGAYHHFDASVSMPFIPGGDMDEMVLPIKAVRAGFLDLGKTAPLVQFPSYHAACCVIYAWAAWPTKLRYPMLVMNGLMLVATPIYGCHYLCDIIAGMALAALSIEIAKLIVLRVNHPILSNCRGRGPHAEDAGLARQT